jgi:hypothetical protein
MTEPNPSPIDTTDTWPLTAFVRAQLAIAAVWGSYLVGVLILLPIAALLLLLGRPADRVLDGRVVLGIAVVVGALINMRVMPKVWPAARQITSRRLFHACLLGPAATMLLGVGARHLGMIPGTGSMDPSEAVTILACTIGGAAASWFLLQPTSVRGENPR